MDFSIAFTIFEFIILFFSSSLEATTIGFGAPLIHRTSPKHPLYNPHTTHKDIIRQKKRISYERQRYFANQKLSFGTPPHKVLPVESDVVIIYYLGTPQIESYANFDTGSNIIWLQCQPCVKCFNQTDPLFDPKKSSTYQQVECQSQTCKGEYGFSCGNQSCNYDISYVDGSSSHGAVGTDTLTLPDYEYSPQFTLQNTIFGCGNNNDNNFTFGASGIFGLQNSSVSLIGQTHVDAFSYCRSSGGGYINFGPMSPLVGLSTTLFTDSFGRYQAIMLGIDVEFLYEHLIVNLDVPSDIFKNVENDPNTGLLVDSGTPYTFLHPVVWDELMRKFGDFMNFETHETYDWKHCYNADINLGITLETLPSVHFRLDKNATIVLPNENVWTDKDEYGSICLKMFPNENNLTIIGSEQLTDYNVGFDLKQNLLWLDYQLACDF